MTSESNKTIFSPKNGEMGKTGKPRQIPIWVTGRNPPDWSPEEVKDMKNFFVKNGGSDSTIFLGNNTASLGERNENITESYKTRYYRVFLGEKKA